MAKNPTKKIERGAPQEAGVEAVDRALNILLCFKEGDSSLSLNELSVRTKYYKSTILRLCTSLERGGFISRLPDKSFALGSQLMRLGALYQRTLRIEHHIRPVLRRLREETEESASFYRREGTARLCLFREDSKHLLRDHIREGDLLPLDKGAAGHVLTTFDPNLNKSPARVHTPDSLIFVSVGERDREIAAIATPIFASANSFLGALSLSGPVSRFGPKKIQKMRGLILREGQQLSRVLGGGDAF